MEGLYCRKCGINAQILSEIVLSDLFISEVKSTLAGRQKNEANVSNCVYNSTKNISPRFWFILKGPIHSVFDWESTVEGEGREGRKPLAYRSWNTPYLEGV